MILEILSDSIEAAEAAVQGGADRIELCENLLEGGVTPSIGCMELTRNRIDSSIFVMIRPRGGDFLYSDLEFQIMRRNIQVAKEIGIDGVVLGILQADGNIDVERTAELVELARPMQVTFHRAFDTALEPESALEDVISTGADRLLTSGMAGTATEGLDVICNLITQSAGRIIVMPGGGLNSSNVQHIAEKTGANEFHFSAKSIIESKMTFRRDTLSIGYQPSVSEYQRYSVDVDKVRKVRELLSEIKI